MSSEAPDGVAEEARRLFEALDERWPGWLRELPGSVATGSGECRLCPVCRFIALVRDRDDPETRRVFETLSTAAASVLGLLDSVLDDRRRDDRRRHAASDAVEHIDIG